jgi:hypothetical protein
VPCWALQVAESPPFCPEVQALLPEPALYLQYTCVQVAEVVSAETIEKETISNAKTATM